MVSATPNTRQHGIAHRVWKWLIDPSPRLESRFRTRGQLLSILCLIQIIALIIAVFLGWNSALYTLPTLIGITATALIYGLNRHGYYLPAAYLSILYISVHPYLLLTSWGVYNDLTVCSALIRIVFALILSFVLVDLRGVSIAVAGNLSFLALSPFVLDMLVYNLVFVPLYLNTLVGTLILLAAVMRRFDQRQQQAQRHALEESEERYRTLFEAAFEGISVQSGGRIIDTNSEFERMFGYTVEEMRGMSVLSFFAPEYRQAATGWVSTTETYQAEALRKDGTRFWGEAKFKDGMYRGQPVRFAAVHDITERKQADEQRIELAIEREKVNVLKRFISNLSHDLRTPLSVIKTSIYLIPRLQDEEKRQQHIEALEEETSRLQSMLDDLLSMSRLDKADTSEYRFAITQINPLIEICVAEAQAMALRKRQTLTFIPGDDIPTVILDSNEFKRMIKHLISNGIVYTPESGSVTVLTRTENGTVIIEVQDTGIGIPEHELPHIFERLYRVDPSRGAVGGTGLGLSIARKIVEAHSGTIEVESEVGAGSVFRVRLPSSSVMYAASSSAHPAGTPVNLL